MKDTVQPYNQYTGEGTGFSFNGFNSWNLLSTIYRALTVYYQRPDHWAGLVRQAMEKDFSWQQPTQQYLDIYRSLLNEG